MTITGYSDSLDWVISMRIHIKKRQINIQTAGNGICYLSRWVSKCTGIHYNYLYYYNEVDNLILKF